MKTVYLAADHGGFQLKERLELELEVNKESMLYPLATSIDLGPDEYLPDDDYPDYAKLLCEKLAQDTDALGILICRSGIGMSIVANRYNHIFAALCFTKQHARLAREHNFANVLVLDADFSDPETQIEIVHEFLTTEPLLDEVRHSRRISKIKEISGL